MDFQMMQASHSPVHTHSAKPKLSNDSPSAASLNTAVLDGGRSCLCGEQVELQLRLMAHTLR